MKKSNLQRSLLATLLALTLTILFIGILAVYNASVAEGFSDFGNKYHFAVQQIKWAIIGLLALGVFYSIPISFYKKIALPAFIFSLILMVAVIIPGVSNKLQGARRWINIAGFTLQPSEFLKLSLVLYLAAWLEKPRQLRSLLLILGVVIGLTMLQPDLGTAIILATTGFLIFYISGAALSQLIPLAIGGFFFGTLMIIASPYRRARLFTFLDPTNDPLGTSYHINQVLLALGSGGWTGVGLGRSRQKYQYLPEATTDSIFAVIGEELGFIGSVILILLILSLILIAIRIALKSTDRFQQLLATGIASWIAVQFLLNIAAMVAIVPLTGIPLPLISYGGSSLITTLAGIGILANIARSIKT